MGMAAVGPGKPLEFGFHTISKLVLEEGSGMMQVVSGKQSGSSL